MAPCCGEALVFDASVSDERLATRARLAAQTFFCEKQLENDKTRKALERSMGAERTDRYMTQVLFDVNEWTPTEAVR